MLCIMREPEPPPAQRTHAYACESLANWRGVTVRAELGDPRKVANLGSNRRTACPSRDCQLAALRNRRRTEGTASTGEMRYAVWLTAPPRRLARLGNRARRLRSQ